MVRAIPYYCHDCRVMYTVYWNPTVRKTYCPKCGDNIATSRNPYTTGKPPDMVKKPKWTDAEKERLKYLYETTAMMNKEIAAELGKTPKSVTHMIGRLNLRGESE